MSDPKLMFPKVYGSVNWMWCYALHLEEILRANSSDIFINYSMINETKALRIWHPPRHKTKLWNTVRPDLLREVLVPHGWVKHLLDVYPDGTTPPATQQIDKYLAAFKRQGFFTIRSTDRRPRTRELAPIILSAVIECLKPDYQFATIETMVYLDPSDGSRTFDVFVYDTTRFEQTICTYFTPYNEREIGLETEGWFSVSHEYTGLSNYVTMLRRRIADQNS